MNIVYWNITTVKFRYNALQGTKEKTHYSRESTVSVNAKIRTKTKEKTVCTVY